MYWQATKWCKRNDYCDFIYRLCLSYFFVYWSVYFLNTNSLAGLHQNWGSTYTRKFEKQQVFGFKMGGRLKHNRLNIQIEVNQKLRNFGISLGCLLALTGCFWHPQRRLRHNTAFTASPPPPPRERRYKHFWYCVLAYCNLILVTLVYSESVELHGVTNRYI